MACRVDGSRPARSCCSTVAGISAVGRCLGCDALDLGAHFGGRFGRVDDGQRQAPHWQFIRVRRPFDQLLGPLRRLQKPVAVRYPDGPRQHGHRVGQLGPGGGGDVRHRGPAAGRREPLDGELGVEQPQGEVLAADPRPQRTGVDSVFDLSLDHQRRRVEPAGPDPQPAPAPLVELAAPHDVGRGVDDDRHPRSQRPNGLPQNTFRSIGHQEDAPDEAAQRCPPGSRRSATAARRTSPADTARRSRT